MYGTINTSTPQEDNIMDTIDNETTKSTIDSTHSATSSGNHSTKSPTTSGWQCAMSA